MILASGLNTVTTQRTTGPRYSDSKATFEHDDFFCPSWLLLRLLKRLTRSVLKNSRPAPMDISAAAMFTFVKDDTKSWKLSRKYLLTGWFPLWSARSTWNRNYQETTYILFTSMETDIKSSLLFESIVTFSLSFLWIALWIKTIRPPSKIIKWLIWPKKEWARKKINFNTNE